MKRLYGRDGMDNFYVYGSGFATDSSRALVYEHKDAKADEKKEITFSQMLNAEMRGVSLLY